jgi:hypothetical protein
MGVSMNHRHRRSMPPSVRMTGSERIHGRVSVTAPETRPHCPVRRRETAAVGASRSIHPAGGGGGGGDQRPVAVVTTDHRPL